MELIVVGLGAFIAGFTFFGWVIFAWVKKDAARLGGVVASMIRTLFSMQGVKDVAIRDRNGVMRTIDAEELARTIESRACLCIDGIADRNTERQKEWQK